MTPPQPHPHPNCHKCNNFFKCEELPPCALLIHSASQQRIDALNDVLQWAKKHHWPTEGGHRVIGYEKLKEAIALLQAGRK